MPAPPATRCAPTAPPSRGRPTSTTTPWRCIRGGPRPRGLSLTTPGPTTATARGTGSSLAPPARTTPKRRAPEIDRPAFGPADLFSCLDAWIVCHPAVTGLGQTFTNPARLRPYARPDYRSHSMINLIRQARQGLPRRQGGFTLVELLVVIAILGILAAIVLFNISGVNASAACNAMRTDGATIQGAADLYYNA